MIERVLRNVGMFISTASTPEDGIREALSNRPDLIILDLNYAESKYSGLDFLKVRKDHLELSKIPIIVFSSLTQKTIVLRSIRLGASDYLVKPLNATQLLGKIRKIFDQGDGAIRYFNASEMPSAEVLVPCELDRVGELNMVINGPIRFTPNLPINLDTPLLSILKLDSLTFKTGRMLGTKPNGFVFTLNYVGISEAQKSAIRQMGTQWNR